MKLGEQPWYCRSLTYCLAGSDYTCFIGLCIQRNDTHSMQIIIMQWIPVWKDRECPWNHSPTFIHVHGVNVRLGVACKVDCLYFTVQAGLWFHKSVPPTTPALTARKGSWPRRHLPPRRGQTSSKYCNRQSVGTNGETKFPHSRDDVLHNSICPDMSLPGIYKWLPALGKSSALRVLFLFFYSINKISLLCLGLSNIR